MPDEMPASFEGAVEWVRAKAEAIRGDKPLGLWTEVGRRLVLVGIATPEASGVVQVDREEYDGLAVLRMLEARGG